MPGPLILAGLAAAPLAGRVGAHVARYGTRLWRSRQALTGFGRASALGLGAAGAVEISGRAVGSWGGGPPATIPSQRMSAAGSGFPVQFVKQWQAGAATFAIDNEGRRWVFRVKLGYWKRVKVVRNIVISGKDMYRARRLIRVSRRLQTMRHQLGTYSSKRKRIR